MLREMVQQIGRQPLAGAVGSRVMPHLDRFVGRMTRGKTRLTDVLFPTLMLTTTGRKSGLQRETPLLYVRDGAYYVVVASNWGQPHQPAWSLNLLANPEALVETREGRFMVKARRAGDDEKAELWPRLTELWPGYDDYVQRAADRTVRVFLLEPTEP